jgi:hypothetical protein
VVAGSSWVGDVGVLAAHSPAPQRLTGVRESTAPSLVVSVQLPPAGSVPVDVMDPALAPPPTGASSTGVSVLLVVEDPLVPAVAPWSPDEVE